MYLNSQEDLSNLEKICAFLSFPSLWRKQTLAPEPENFNSLTSDPSLTFTVEIYIGRVRLRLKVSLTKFSDSRA